MRKCVKYRHIMCRSSSSLFSISYSILYPLNYIMSMSSPELEQECPIKNPSSILESFNEMVGFVQIPHPPISEHLYTGFLLPIEYLEKSQIGRAHV